MRIIRNGRPSGSIEITENAVNAIGLGMYFKRYAYEYDSVEGEVAIIDQSPSERAWRDNANLVRDVAVSLGVQLEETT